MKVYGVLFMSAGYAEKSADGQAIKRIQTLGKNLIQWTSDNLCYEDRCLKAVTKETGNWEFRINKVVERLEFLYEKCGSTDNGGRRKRESELDYDEDYEEDYEKIFDEDYEGDDTYQKTMRFNREDPVKGVGQLTSAIRKWSLENLTNCVSKTKSGNQGIDQISLRMHKWKVILENGFHKVHKDSDEMKPTPSSWANWYQKKVAREVSG